MRWEGAPEQALQERPGGGGRGPSNGSVAYTCACTGARAFIAAGGIGVACCATGGTGAAALFVAGRTCCG